MKMGIRIHPPGREPVRNRRVEIMDQQGGQEDPPLTRSNSGNEGAQHLSTRGLVIVVAAIAIALVLGYLLLNKLVDMSQEEDCALAHRHNCAAVEVPR
jgi:hypothetical protein